MGANIDEFLNIEINDNDSSLLGGEMKKISILRGLMKNSSLFILDEPGNSLDESSKKKLKSMLIHMKKSRIIILISHDVYFNSILNYKIKL